MLYVFAFYSKFVKINRIKAFLIFDGELQDKLRQNNVLTSNLQGYYLYQINLSNFVTNIMLHHNSTRKTKTHKNHCNYKIGAP